eukprot:TRINITY_DN32727_c0_g1_i1.p1 TRINITY_DN32727_c0_g1~~TRINITY_DN32727_c0_g1_i1.p1  ORF type:complete len:736 (-),score=189.06 TRINITY_DN32727_c0_g1_i1:197-2404(-)
MQPVVPGAPTQCYDAATPHDDTEVIMVPLANTAQAKPLSRPPSGHGQHEHDRHWPGDAPIRQSHMHANGGGMHGVTTGGWIAGVPIDGHGHHGQIPAGQMVVQGANGHMMMAPGNGGVPMVSPHAVQAPLPGYVQDKVVVGNQPLPWTPQGQPGVMQPAPLHAAMTAAVQPLAEGGLNGADHFMPDELGASLHRSAAKAVHDQFGKVLRDLRRHMDTRFDQQLKKLDVIVRNQMELAEMGGGHSPGDYTWRSEEKQGATLEPDTPEPGSVEDIMAHRRGGLFVTGAEDDQPAASEGVPLEVFQKHHDNETEDEEQDGDDGFSKHRPKGRSEGRPVDKLDELWVDGETVRMAYMRNFATFIRSSKFDHLMGIIIVLNTLFLGIQIDIKARSMEHEVDPEDPMPIKIMESLFAFVFSCELGARLYAFHPRFCCSGWNVFDTVVVTSALLEEVTKYAPSDADSPMGKLSAIRVLKVLKLLRALRIIRVVRAFRELRIVISSIANCMSQLFWTISLLTILIYMVCILILVELTSQGERAFETSIEGDKRKRYFSDLVRTLMTLFQCTTFGALWEDASRSLEELIPWLGIIWAAYMGFVVFAFQNTVSGLCVDKVCKMAQEDMRNVCLDEHENREVAHIQIRHLMLDADPEGRGFLSRRQMATLLKDPEMLEQLKSVDIDPRDILAFVGQMTGISGVLNLADVDVFISCCFRLRGTALNSDSMVIAMRQRELCRKAGLEN